MGTGQMLLTVGAIILLGTVILTTNRRIISTSDVMNTSNYGLEEVALATKVIQEAQSKSYDQATADGNTITGTSCFSTTLGQDSGADDYDDFDDYNGYSKVFTGLATGDYQVKARVTYVTLDPSTGVLDTTSVPQWSKRLDVWVWNTVDTSNVVHMHTIMSYWK